MNRIHTSVNYEYMNDFDIISSPQLCYNFFVGQGGVGLRVRGGGGTLMQRTSEFLLCICE